MEGLQGVVHVEVATDALPNIVTVARRTNGLPLRDIIKQIKELGFESAKYQPEGDDNSIQNILHQEVKRYRKKFLLALIIEIPILIMMWVVPYTNRDFLTDHIIVNGMPLYIFILLGLSSII